MARTARILLYHRVGPRDGSYMDNYTVSPGTFWKQMRLLVRRNWRPVPLAEVIGRRLDDCPPRAVAITFDDGFASNREHAWPVLNELGIPAATFVVTNRLGAASDWDPPHVPRFPLLSLDDLRNANPTLMTFHSHTSTHPNLKSVENEPPRLAEELEGALESLASLPAVGKVFAYPFGAWTWRLKRAVERAGYAAACTCMEGLNTRATDPFVLRRTSINEVDVGWRFEVKLVTGRDGLRWPPQRPALVDELFERARWWGSA